MMLKDMEGELQCKLFSRQGHRLKITEEGKRLLEVANTVCSVINAAEQEFKSNASQSLNLYSCDYYYHAIMPAFDEKIPSNLFLHVVPNKDIPPHLLERMAAGAICDDYYLQHVKTEDIVKRFLFQEDLYLYVPEGHHWEGRDSIDVSEIGNTPLFCYSSNEGLSEWVNDMAILNKVEFNYAMAMDKTLSAMYMNNIPYPRFISSRVAWNLDSVPHKQSCFVSLKGAYTQRDICLWYHKHNYSSFRETIDGICARSVELNNYIICFRGKIDIPNTGIIIKHFFS